MAALRLYAPALAGLERGVAVHPLSGAPEEEAGGEARAGWVPGRASWDAANEGNFCALCGRRNLRDFGCPGRNCARYACWCADVRGRAPQPAEKQTPPGTAPPPPATPPPDPAHFFASIKDAAAAARETGAKKAALAHTGLAVPFRRPRATLDTGSTIFHLAVVPFQAAFDTACGLSATSGLGIAGVAAAGLLVATTGIESAYVLTLRRRLHAARSEAAGLGFYVREADGTRRRIAHDAGKERREAVLALLTPPAVLARISRTVCAALALGLACNDVPLDCSDAQLRTRALLLVLRAALGVAAVSGGAGAAARRTADAAARTWLTSRLGSNAALVANVLSYAVAFACAAHALACAWGVVARIPPTHETTWLRQLDADSEDGRAPAWDAYAFALHWAVGALVTAGTTTGPAAPQTAAEQGVAAIAAVLGAAAAASGVARLCVHFASADAPASRERALLASLRSAVGEAAVANADPIREKLLAYFAFRHESGFDAAEAARRTLASAPPSLRAAAMLAAEPWLPSTTLLREGTGTFHLRIASLLERMLCPPGEEVFVEHSVQRSLYLVRGGLVAVAGGAYAGRTQAFGFESLAFSPGGANAPLATYTARAVTFADLLHCRSEDVLAAAADQPPRVRASLRRAGLLVIARAEILAYASAWRMREGWRPSSFPGPYLSARMEHYTHRLNSVRGAVTSDADAGLRRVMACLLVQRRVRRFLARRRASRREGDAPATCEQVVALGEELEARLRRVEASCRAAGAAVESQRVRQESLLDALVGRVEAVAAAAAVAPAR